MYFGVHECIPGPATYVTMLREPISRTVSLYNYYMTARKKVEGVNIRPLSYDEDITTFMRGGYSLQADNGQTRFISGMKELAYGECDNRTLQKAKSNLDEYFDIIGLQERFDESILLIAKRFNWSFPFYVRMNASSSTATVPTNEEIKVIEEYNRYDIDLYKYAKELFECQIQDWGDDFQRVVSRYRLVNRLLGRSYCSGWDKLSKLKIWLKNHSLS